MYGLLMAGIYDKVMIVWELVRTSTCDILWHLVTYVCTRIQSYIRYGLSLPENRAPLVIIIL